MNPKYPVYVISRGRWQPKRRLTINFFNKINIPYHVVIEPDEYESYASELGKDNLLVVPLRFHEEFNPCMDLNEGESQGSGPARNFCWWHSVNHYNSKRHWVVDDNIRYFFRLNRNKKIRVNDGTIFRCMEDFTDRYDNVVLSGPHYGNFAHRKDKLPPFIINTRIFSCILIRNDIPFRWRARYNEDVDLSLRVLKAGYATIQFYAFLQQKTATLMMKGGNTDTIYVDGTLQKSKMIVTLHPDVARLKYRWNRWHHYVDYTQFKNNPLMLKEGLSGEDINNYGMKLIRVD